MLVSLMSLALILSVSPVNIQYANAQAQLGGGNGADLGGGGGANLGGGGGDNAGQSGSSTDTATIENPIQVDSIAGFIERVLGIILKLGIPIVALAIIYAGFKFVMAQGNAGKLEEAKSTFLYTLVGAALLLGAWVVGSIVKATIEAIAKP